MLGGAATDIRFAWMNPSHPHNSYDSIQFVIIVRQSFDETSLGSVPVHVPHKKEMTQLALYNYRGSFTLNVASLTI